MRCETSRINWWREPGCGSFHSMGFCSCKGLSTWISWTDTMKCFVIFFFCICLLCVIFVLPWGKAWSPVLEAKTFPKSSVTPSLGRHIAAGIHQAEMRKDSWSGEMLELLMVLMELPVMFPRAWLSQENSGISGNKESLLFFWDIPTVSPLCLCLVEFQTDFHNHNSHPALCTNTLSLF